MILIHAAAAIISLVSPPRTDSTALARRIAASVQLAAQEYRFGVRAGRVIAPSEVAEARLFLAEALRTTQLLPPKVAGETAVELRALQELVNAVGSPDSVDAVARRATALLADGLGVVLVDIPEQPPSLARGRELYQRECTICHGASGAGDGAAAKALSPPPANLASGPGLDHATPLSFYQRITIGVAGTAMPSYETRLPAEDRWALAEYATSLRHAPPSGEVPPALRSFALTATLDDGQLRDSLGADASPAELAAVRLYQTSISADAVATAVFDTVRARIAAAVTLAADGRHDDAAATALDAYLEFEKVERTVRTRKPDLATTLEASFATLRARLGGGATPDEVTGVHRELLASLEQAERIVGDRMSAANLFGQSLMILLREGLEAILIIGALMAFLVRTGAGHRKRDIHIGVGAAVALTVLTAVLLQTVFVLSAAHRELIEGFTLVAAVGVLFYVSYWLLSRMESTRWTAFVKQRVAIAVTGGSALALASAAFLAVYREGFETVLFYEALFMSGGAAGGTFWPVMSGILVGSSLLALVYLAINRWGVRLPLAPFFGVTSAFLYYTAFVFAGKAVAELQEGGVLGTTILLGWPRLPALGIYPTVESVLAQGVLLLLAVVALVWVFVGRARLVSGSGGGDPELPPEVLPIISVGDGATEATMLRSLERMDADLSALKSEVSRLRDAVVDATADEVSKPR